MKKRIAKFLRDLAFKLDPNLKKAIRYRKDIILARAETRINAGDLVYQVNDK